MTIRSLRSPPELDVLHVAAEAWLRPIASGTTVAHGQMNFHYVHTYGDSTQLEASQRAGDPELTDWDVYTSRYSRPKSDLVLIRREDGAQTVRFQDPWTKVLGPEHGCWQLLSNVGCWVESWDTRGPEISPMLQICFDYSGDNDNARMHCFRPRSFLHGPLARMLCYECSKYERGRQDIIRIAINDHDSGTWRIPSDYVVRQEARQRHADFLFDNGLLEDHIPDVLGRRTGTIRPDLHLTRSEDRPYQWRTMPLTPPPRSMGSTDSPANLTNFVSPQIPVLSVGGARVRSNTPPPPPPLPTVKQPPPRRSPECTPEYRRSSTERVE